MKKRLSVFIIAIVAMMMSALPQTVQAQTREAYVVKNSGDKTLTFYYDTNRHTWEGNAGFQVYGIDEKYLLDDELRPGWISITNQQYITQVVFDASFKDYRPISTASWFYKLKKLEKISGIENLNTENVTDMSKMFYDCETLQSLDVSGFNTENVTDMSEMFDACILLTSLDVSGFNTDKVTDMSSMFHLCSVLTSLDVSGFNTENVTDMSEMFYNCKVLQSLDVSGFNTDKVTDMSEMFYGCKALQSLDVSGFNTENVTNMCYMFGGCAALQSLDVSGFNTDKVTDMANMFFNCEALQSLDLLNFNTGNVTCMAHMFTKCGALTTIYCNDTWTCSGISNWMFGGCFKLVGAVAYDENKTDVAMANPYTGYFTKKITEGIERTTADVPAKKQGTYNLQGVRMADDMSKLPKGIYIVGGEKVVKK